MSPSPEESLRTDSAYALELDRQDELAVFRDEFIIEDPELIYLDGNSLGRLPRRTVQRLRDAVEQEWGGRLIRAWNEGWFTAAERIGAKIGRLIGAGEDEVVLADSTSVNLYKLTMAALEARPERSRVVSDDLNFPSDMYILQRAIQHAGTARRLDVVPSPDGLVVPFERLAAAIDDDTALVTLSHTVFKSGFTYDLAAVTARAHEVGALVLWDLSHSAGALPADLKAAGADLAVGCTYKYLNGGPGAPAFLYIRRDLQAALRNPITGWFSQEDQFALEPDYHPAAGMRSFLTGTPPTLSLLAVEPGVDLLLEAGIDRLRAKSVQQTEYLIGLWRAWLEPLGFSLNTPTDPALRGSHVSLGHAEALGIDLALIHEKQVLPDFRYPDNIRLGIAPIYTSFAEIHEAARRIQAVVEEGLHQKYAGARPEVL